MGFPTYTSDGKLVFWQQPGAVEPPGSGARPKPKQQSSIVLHRQSFVQNRIGNSAFECYIKAVLCRAGYLGNEGVNEQLRGAVSADSVTLIHSPNPLVPNMWLWKWNGLGCLIIINGTTNLAQWLSHLVNADQVDMPVGGGRVYSSFLIAATQCLPLVMQALTQAVAGESHFSYALAGHSLGGAVAHILGRMLPAALNGWGPTLCTTFGCPRVGNPDYRKNGDPYTTRVVYEKDPVTAVPPPVYVRTIGVDPSQPLFVVPARYTHPAARRVGLLNGEMSLNEGNSTESSAGKSAYFGLGQSLNEAKIATFHAIKRYTSELYQAMRPEQRRYPFIGSMHAIEDEMASLGG